MRRESEFLGCIAKSEAEDKNGEGFSWLKEERIEGRELNVLERKGVVEERKEKGLGLSLRLVLREEEEDRSFSMASMGEMRVCCVVFGFCSHLLSLDYSCLYPHSMN